MPVPRVRPGAAVTQVQRDRAIDMAGLDEHRRTQRPALVSQLHHVAGGGTEAVRGRRAENRGIVPGQLW